MALLSDVIGRGTLAARPAAGTAGRLYYATDTTALYRDNGTGWDQLVTASGLTNPMTTANDLIVGGASGAPARLAKGADGQVLTVDPTTHNLVWATPSGGGGGAGLLSTATAAGGEAYLDVAIPSGKGLLELVVMGKSDAVDNATPFRDLLMQCNGDTGSNYIYDVTAAGGTAAASAGSTNPIILRGTCTGTSVDANGYNALSLRLLNPSETTHHKRWAGQGVRTSQVFARHEIGGTWLNTAALTTIRLSWSGGNWLASSTIRLYDRS